MINNAPENSKSVVLIGAGNLAFHLGKKLYEKGFKIVQVFSRTNISATALARIVLAEPINDLKKVITDADFYFFCLKDDAIADAVKIIPALNGIVVHTSGSIPLNALSASFENSGIIYPVQTFNKHLGKVNFEAIPLCIEANNEYTLQSILHIAKHLSKNVIKVNAGQRQVIHLSAVFACNFVNHMFAIADKLLKKENLDLTILQPLIEETVAKAKVNPPSAVQTGPAVRKDKKTMEQHLKLLEQEKDYQEIYRLLTQNILNSHRK